MRLYELLIHFVESEFPGVEVQRDPSLWALFDPDADNYRFSLGGVHVMMAASYECEFFVGFHVAFPEIDDHVREGEAPWCERHDFGVDIREPGALDEIGAYLRERWGS